MALAILPAPWLAHAQNERGALGVYALRPEEVHAGDPFAAPRRHRVSGDETLYDIAVKYQIPMLSLIAHNSLTPPYALAPGVEIELPPPRSHVVQSGEVLRSIAARYAIDPRSLALFNRLTPPYDLQPGQRLALPAVAAAPAAPPAAVQAPLGGAPVARRGAGLVWPLQGRIVGRFGARAEGGRLDGIEIAAREGAGIAAAGDGEVVYAGADIAAYGTLVIVRHAGDLVSAYAYAGRALVHEGQSVRAGARIAEVGARGQLLFQVRRGADVIDPMSLLPPAR